MTKKVGAKTKLLNYLLQHVGENVPGSVLDEVADGVRDWQRSLRSLRDDGYVYEYNHSNDTYVFPYDHPVNEPKDNRHISKTLKSEVMLRDNSTCQMCGRDVKHDKIKVNIDHIVPHSWGGKTELSNLQVLCSECNEGKKNYVKSEDPVLMEEISKATSAAKRMKLYFEFYPEQPIGVDKLSVIAKSRDWTRALRNMRTDYDMDIEYRRKNKADNKEYYIYHPNKKDGV